MKFIAECALGLEELVSVEIKQHNGKILDTKSGIIIFETQSLPDIKTADFYLLIKKLAGISRYRTTLRNLRHQLRKTKLKIKTFSIDVSYNGRRDYTAEEVKELVKEELAKKNHIYSENSKNIVKIILSQDISLIGLGKAKKRLKTVPGSLNNSVANALLNFAEIRKDDLVLDPMCGSGMIVIEAEKLGVKAIGGDINLENIKIAKQNSRDVEFHVWDARKTSLKDNSVDKIICNLPFGKQTKVDDKDFFNSFIDEMARISKKESKWIFLTGKDSELRKNLKGNLNIVKEIKIINSGLESEILVIEFIRQS